VPGVRTVSTGGCESGKCRIVGGMNKHKGVNRNTHRDQPRARSPTKSHWTGKTHGFIQYKYFENNPTVTTSNPPSCQWGVAATITDEAASSLPSQPKRRAICHCWTRWCLSCGKVASQTGRSSVIAGPAGACHHSRQLPLPEWSCGYSITFFNGSSHHCQCPGYRDPACI